MEIIKGKRLTKPQLLFYGKPGAGKSTAASEFASPFFLGNEVPMFLDVHKAPPTKVLNDFREPLEFLLNGQHDYKTLVIDSLDGAQDMFRNENCHGENYKSPNTIWRGYGEFWNQLRSWYIGLRTFYLEPLSKKMTLIYISHEKEEQVEGVDKPFIASKPNLESKLYDSVINYVDGIFYFMQDPVTVRKGENIVNKNSYKIYTQGTKYWVAKNRWDLQEFYQYERGKTIGRIRQAIGDFYKQGGK